MSYTVLARKYRPQKFADVIGQDHVVRTLKNALEQKRIAHGYIFSGHRGIGKTTIARILAMALTCRSSDGPVSEPSGECDSCREIRDGSVGAMDVIEIDAATNRGIEDVRSLIATATAEPARDRYRIFILDEAHQVTDAAFNALLKTLEEPPPWVVFMMATTQPEDIPQTIRSRCQHFSFHAVRFEEIVTHLGHICQMEKLTVDNEALALLAEAGDGSMRDALSILDQAISCSGDKLSADDIRGLIGNVSSELLERVMQAVHQNSADEVLRIVDKLIVEGQSATHFARQLVRFLRNALVAKVAGVESPALQISSDEKRRVQGVAELFSEEDLTRFLQIMLRTFGDVSYKQEQRFHLELGLLKLVHAQRMLPLEQLLSSVRLGEASTSSAPARGALPSATSSSAGKPAATRTPPPMATRPPGVPPMGGGSSSPFGGKASPFEADKARKGREDLTSTTEPIGESRGVNANITPISSLPMSAAQNHMTPPMPLGKAQAGTVGFDNGSALAVAPQTASALNAGAPLDVEKLREAVLDAMEKSGSQMLVHALEEGEWSAEGNQLTVKVTMSASMVEISYTREQERAANQAATHAAGRTVKVRLVGGATVTAAPKARAPRTGGEGNFRAKAADEPLVKHMQEKFGAEIRMIVDRSRE